MNPSRISARIVFAVLLTILSINGRDALAQSAADVPAKSTRAEKETMKLTLIRSSTCWLPPTRTLTMPSCRLLWIR